MLFRVKKKFQDIILLKPRFKDHLYDITPLIELTIRNSSIKRGIANLDIKSKSSAIIIRNEMTFQAKKAFIKELETIIFSHNNESTNSKETDLSIQKASLIGTKKTISFEGNKLILLDSERIFFCEFENPGLIREIIVTIYRN